MDGTVYGSAFIVLAAEIPAQGFFLIFCNMYGMVHKFVHAFSFGCGNRYHGGSEHLLHRIDIDTAAVSGQLVHHIQRHNHRNVHLKKLHC